MTINEIRTKFLEFFKSKEHKHMTSDSLVPKDDPTVLFTTAGMQQFKRQFLGHLDDYTRATTSQKCMRTDDLDEVGRTDFHHTFFEMLGNFSFGDYFKLEAIEWAWEFLTQVMDIPADRLWVSVHKDDTEAKDIWMNTIKLPKERIFMLGDKSNFWPADAIKKGPNGPCGPCSEIFFDWEPEKSAIPDPDDPRLSEVWNLVFTQFERKEGGVLDPLPNKNIDTGMGLERLTAVLQRKKNNYETNLFAPILKSIDDLVKIPTDPTGRNLRYVVADHIRGIVFGINDGVIPSNEGRGYVIKKLIIDSIDIILRAGHNEATIYKLVPAVLKAMGEAYPELKDKAQNIADTILSVEKAYIKLRGQRIPELKDTITSIQASKNPESEKIQSLGEITFRYRDTYGLTLPTIENVFKENGFSKDQISSIIVQFENHMSHQKKQSRESSKMMGDVFTGTDLNLNLPKTDFIGYEHAFSTSTILKLYIDNLKVNEVSKGDRIKFALDKSPFYAESGGQVGDTGYVNNERGSILVEDTQKIDNVIIHIGIVEEGHFKTDDLVKAEIDIDRRLSIMRNHTATHILQFALREVLGDHIKQQGSFVAEDRLRFDFTHPKAITREQLNEAENIVNAHIRDCDTITQEYLPIEQAKKIGALAFFAEKYGDIVRVITIGNYSKEFCGGTHLSMSGQIGLLQITNESAIAQGIRRIEAKTGAFAIDRIHERTHMIDQLTALMKTSESELSLKADTMTKKIKSLEKDLEQYQFEAIKNNIDAIISSGENINDCQIIAHIFDDIEMSLLRRASDIMKQKTQNAVILLGAKSSENASILLSVSDNLVKKGIKANELIKSIIPLINGKGGGKPQLAQAGSKETHSLNTAFEEAQRLIKDKLNT